MKILILAIGSIKRTLYEPLFHEYMKRLSYSASAHEIIVKQTLSPTLQKQKEGEMMQALIPPSTMLVCLDENGQNFKSTELATWWSSQEQHQSHITFCIGGSHGLCPTILNRCHFKLSFGAATWPHLMVRVLLAEQLYRTQQILKGHPYHRP